MPNTISNNPLDELVFKDDWDFQTLENILECLDHVTPKQVSREEFNRLKGDFLVETGEDAFWKRYDLILPSDLQHWEKLNFVFFLSQKFWLENYTPYERIITYVKVMIAIILRNTKEEDTEAYVHWLASKYHLSEEFVERIRNEKMKLSEAKEMIREIKWKKAQEEKWKRLWSDEDIILWSEELKKLFWEQFDLTFFRKWVNMIRLGMMTITQAEQEEKIKYCEDNWFEKETWSNWEIIYKKWIENIMVKLSSELLDTKERLLRDKIRVDDFKKKLEEVRRSWNRDEIEQLELESSESIIKVLNEYMYQEIDTHNWYQPSKILEYKEVYCVWYALLWHAFLTELWIKHYWLGMYSHSALAVDIWWKNFYFDPTCTNKLSEFGYWKERGVYREIIWKWWSFQQGGFATTWNAEKILISQIYNNRWCVLFTLWRDGEAIEMFDKAIEFTPIWGSFSYNRWIILRELWRFEESIEVFDLEIQLHPKEEAAYRHKGLALFSLWRYEEAIEMFDKTMELNPDEASLYFKKWFAYFKLNRYEEAIEMFDKTIEWNPSSIDAYNIKWISLLKLFRNEEAMESFSKLIEINPQFIYAYHIKWLNFAHLWKEKLSKIYIYISHLLEWKAKSLDILYRKEKRKIKQFIDTKDYEGLRKYLIKLEKE